MRVFIVAILSIFHLAASVGAGLHIHYCMGELAEVSMSVRNENKICQKCGMDNDENNGCCHDDFKFLKITDQDTNTNDLIINSIVINKDISHWPLLINCYSWSSTRISSTVSMLPNSPPDCYIYSGRMIIRLQRLLI